jgi:hypothetical protein
VAARVIAPEHRLERAEVADVVSWPHPHAELVASSFQLREERKDGEEIVRLEEYVRFVRRPPHRHRELELPAMDAKRGDTFEDPSESRNGQAVDLRVACCTHISRAHDAQRLERGAVGTADTAQAVVRLLVAVDRDANTHEPGVLGASDHVFGEATAARRHRHVHSPPANRAHDVEPILAEVSFAADERDLLRPEIGELVDEVERQRRRELIRTLPPRARTAVTAGEVASEGELPDGVDGAMLPVDAACVLRERKVASPRRREGRERKASPRASPCELRGAGLGGQGVECSHGPHVRKYRARPRFPSTSKREGRATMIAVSCVPEATEREEPPSRARGELARLREVVEHGVDYVRGALPALPLELARTFGISSASQARPRQSGRRPTAIGCRRRDFAQ